MENNVFVSIILPLSLAIIMFGMGTTLVKEDFKRVVLAPGAVMVGLLGQLILLPLLGFGLSYAFDLSPMNAVGLIILTACAGGPVSNLVCYFIKADVALSVSLTAMACLVTIFTIPWLVNAALLHFMAHTEAATLPVGRTNLTLFLVTVLPVILGMYLRHRSISLAERLEKPLNIIAMSFFLFIVLAMIIKEKARLAVLLPELGPSALSLNLASMAMGYGLAKLFGLAQKQRATIGIEIGLQNSATGIFIAAALLSQPALAVFSAVYAICMMVNMAIIVALIKIRKSQLFRHASVNSNSP